MRVTDGAAGAGTVSHHHRSNIANVMSWMTNRTGCSGDNMQGVVQAVEFTKKGAKKFQISGGWYYAGRCKVDGLEVGSEIEFAFQEFGEDQGRGRLKGLDWWKPITRGQSQARANGTQKPPDRVSTVVTITDVDVLRSVSNVVGSACAAGTVKSPEELQEWFVAAWAGLQRKPYPKGLGKAAEDDYVDNQGQTPSEPEFDDDIPF